MANITYVKEGENNKSTLIIDGVPVNSSNYGVDSKIHAIQWNGSKGEIEYNDGKPNEIDLTLSFGENQTLDRADIEAGF